MSVDWAVFDAKTNELRCERCGATEPMGQLPMDLTHFCDILHGFQHRHENCEPAPTLREA